MEESILKGGFESLEEYVQEYVEIFMHLQQGEEQASGFYQERCRLLDERERKTEFFLPAVCLRECCHLTRVEYWIVMFAFCCELEGGLCIDFRNRYRENWPSLQYALHLLSTVMPVGFSDVADLYRKNGVLQDILALDPEEEAEMGGRKQSGFLQRPLLLNSAAFYFLLTGELFQEDWYTFYAANDEEDIPEGQELLPLHEKEYGRFCGYLESVEPLRILLYGSRGSGSHTLVRRVCRKMHTNVVFLRSKSLVCISSSFQTYICQVLRLMVRLKNPMIVVEPAEEFSDSFTPQEWKRMCRRLSQELNGSYLCFLAQTQKEADLLKDDADVRLALKESLSSGEKQKALNSWLSQEDHRQWQEELLEHYRLNIGEWKKRQITMNLRAQADKNSLADPEVWLEVMQERQESFRFGSLVKDRYKPEEIILSADCRRQLETVIRLAKAWKGRKGLQILFHGSSGTGKTMAASVLAGQLQLPLLKVDLSQVFDKYIGETEKHIDEIFRVAGRNHYLLFFDEADALFAKRTAVRDSHDRYANVSAAFLLQRMEEYDGILILATNLKDHFDDAFVRRIRFVVKFRNPDRDVRERLWRKALEGVMPVAQEVDFGALAEAVELSPARISSAAHVAKLLAACDESGTITKEHLMEALSLEAGKDETAIRSF